MSSTDVRVDCPVDGPVEITTDVLHLDDTAQVYRFTCGRCGQGVEKRMDERIRALLRKVGVLTIDELVLAFRALLDDDTAVTGAFFGEAA